MAATFTDTLVTNITMAATFTDTLVTNITMAATFTNNSAIAVWLYVLQWL
jgi:hypothetical protein